MTRRVRGGLVALVVAVVSLLGAAPSLAEPSPGDSADGAPLYGCLGDVDAYGAPGACQLGVQVLSPVCDDDVPKLRYKVDAVGTPQDTVSITWINPTGSGDVVYSDLPLEGTVDWPGAVVGSDGRGVDWPGWHQASDGSWVAGDEYGWVRPSAQVKFTVNTDAVVSVDYPASSPACATEPVRSEVLAAGDVPGAVSGAARGVSSEVLAATGSTVTPFLAVGGALVLLGGVALVTVTVLRRRVSAGQR